MKGGRLVTTMPGLARAGLNIAALALACIMLSAAPESRRNEQVTGERRANALFDASTRGVPRVHPQLSPLRIGNVRLEAPPSPQTPASAVLKFDLFNEGPSRVTDILLEVSVRGKPAFDPGPATARVLVRPFKIRGAVKLEAGYSVNYEVLLRNLSSDCNCVASVEVLSFRALPYSAL
jgi:hypothetical protein